MVKKRTSWVEKLHDSKDLPKVSIITEKMSKRWGSGTVVIPAPLEVDELMRKVPEGKLVTVNGLRLALAKKHNASIGCPMTTGIFAWVAAHAAEELLDLYNFDGNRHDPLNKKDPAGDLALQLATYLDQYNTGAYCGTGG